VLLDFLAQLGDQALTGFGQKLSESEGRDSLDHGRAENREH